MSRNFRKKILGDFCLILDILGLPASDGSDNEIFVTYTLHLDQLTHNKLILHIIFTFFTKITKGKFYQVTFSNYDSKWPPECLLDNEIGQKAFLEKGVSVQLFIKIISYRLSKVQHTSLLSLIFCHMQHFCAQNKLKNLFLKKGLHLKGVVVRLEIVILLPVQICRELNFCATYEISGLKYSSDCPFDDSISQMTIFLKAGGFCGLFYLKCVVLRF